ncbi:MAG: YraN family protein [Cyanobacteria bacterium J06592_8]
MSISSSNRNSSSLRSQTIGTLGEQLVKAWLNQQGWEILSHQYRCRWGEIDLIGREINFKSEPTVIFVEVKTRSKRNWDEDGILAIAPRKQAKLIKSAQMFLSDRFELANLPCRFDVALVRCDRVKSSDSEPKSSFTDSSFPRLSLGQPVELSGYKLTLQNYIQSAFVDEG